MPELAFCAAWPLAWGRPVARARLRQVPADFRVDELMPVNLDGAGEHVWLHIRKTDCNTRDVQASLAQFAGLRPDAVGYSGLKDKRAVCTQWFSVPVPIKQDMDFRQWQMPGCECLSQQRHGRKLRVGTHHGNAFVLRLTHVVGQPAAIESRLAHIRIHGVPNFFGEQRFGRARQNLQRLTGASAGRARVSRSVKGLWLSAARSFLFNEVLARRVLEGSWQRALPGDLLMLDGRHSHFLAEGVDDTVQERVQRGELHPTGPLWGEGGSQPLGSVAVLEGAVVKPYHTLTDFIASQRAESQRRALRLSVRDLTWAWDGHRALTIRFSLPAGSFATAVVRECCTLLDD